MSRPTIYVFDMARKNIILLTEVVGKYISKHSLYIPSLKYSGSNLSLWGIDENQLISEAWSAKWSSL